MGKHSKEHKHKHKSKSKHKKESHKSKKHKSEKSSSSSSDDRSSVSGSQLGSSELATLVSQACCKFPQLLDEFPILLQALDADQGIQLDQLENKSIKSALEEIFLHLPLEMSEEDGVTEFHKSSQVNSLAEWFSSHLVANKYVIEPENLAEEHLLATQSIIHVQNLLKEFPEIRNDVISVLSNILDGSFVQIDSLENERVKTLLTELFESLSLTYHAAKDDVDDEAQETGYGIEDPTSPPAKALEYTLNALQKMDPITEEGEAEDTAAHETNDDTPAQVAPRVGPAMPSQEQLRQAQLAAASYLEKYDLAEDDEDDFGPSVGPAAAAPGLKKLEPPTPAAAAGPELLGLIGTESLVEASPNDAAYHQQGQQQTSSSSKVREEWMLTPGKSQLLGGLKSVLPTTRTFQRGRQAKAVEEERKRKAPQISEEEQKRIDDTLAEHKAKRGKSLVELHQEKVQAKREQQAGIPKERMPFDRERDLSSRQLNSGKVQQMIARAKDFDSKFSKSVQRTFL